MHVAHSHSAATRFVAPPRARFRFQLGRAGGLQVDANWL